MAEWDVELTKDLVTELGIGIPAAEFHHLTDMGNARWLVRLHRGDFRHCWPWKSCMVQDGTRWQMEPARFTAGLSS